jgi:dTDP-4-amino-4,6-dideoxygalactose transaminase
MNVTKPFLPPLDEVIPYLERIWQTGVLSNSGPFHNELERALEDFLGVGHVSLFCNATVALITAQQALSLQGQIITTPYSFVATTHAIRWMGNEPVFVDIEPNSLCLDPALIESAVTENTVAIMPLHCYGNTCDTKRIAEVADRHGLKIIYDACHSFGVSDQQGSVLKHGDVSVVSFHATKVFNTFEGGLLITESPEIKQKVDHLKNFGFVDETVVIESGINGKMSEFNAAVGLAQLPHFSEIISRRAKLDAQYRDLLSGANGIRCLNPVRQSTRNYAYFPIFVEQEYETTRDELYEKLRANGVFGRRYFYPLIPEFDMYKEVPSGDTASLPKAFCASRQVICLPLYPDLLEDQVNLICSLITE